MARAAARSSPSNRMLENGRNGSADLFFFIAGNVAGKGRGGKVLAHGHRFELKSAAPRPHWRFGGEMAEWFKAHAWKACVGNTTVGSNPTLSAIQIFCKIRAGDLHSSAKNLAQNFRHLDELKLNKRQVSKMASPMIFSPEALRHSRPCVRFQQNAHITIN